MEKKKTMNPWKVAFIVLVTSLCVVLVYGYVKISNYRLPEIEGQSEVIANNKAETIELSVSRDVVNAFMDEKLPMEDILIKWVEDKMVIQAHMPIGIVSIPVEIDTDIAITTEGKVALSLSDVKVVGYTLSIAQTYEWLQGLLSNQSWLHFDVASPTLEIDPQRLVTETNVRIRLKSIDHATGQLTLELQQPLDKLLDSL